MMSLFYPKFTTFDIVGIMLAFHLVMSNGAPLWLIAIVGFLWLLVGRFLEREFRSP